MAAVNLACRNYVSDAGEIGTVVSMLDDEGEETDDASAAVVFIAAVGSGFVVEMIDAFEPVRIS